MPEIFAFCASSADRVASRLPAKSKRVSNIEALIHGIDSLKLSMIQGWRPPQDKDGARFRFR